MSDQQLLRYCHRTLVRLRGGSLEARLEFGPVTTRMTSTAAVVSLSATITFDDDGTSTMALSCSESPLIETWSPPAAPTAVETTRRAFVDRVLVDDPRVLDSLLVMDDRHLPSLSYFKFTQPDLQPYMRRMVVTWMMEVHRSRTHVSPPLD